MPLTGLEQASGLKRALSAVLVLAVLLVSAFAGFDRPLRNALTDIRFGADSRDATGKIVFVAIDSRSIDAIGVWPWPRQLHAQLLDRLKQAGAGTTAFDVDFSSPSNPEGDNAFAAALGRFGGSVILAGFEQRAGEAASTASHLNWPLKSFAEHAWVGAVNVRPAKDGSIRQYPYGQMLDGKFVPSLGGLLAGAYEPNKRPLAIDYGIRVSTVPTVSYVDVLDGKPDALRKVKGRSIIVGARAIELGDRFNVPHGKVIPGALLQALAAESIIQGRALTVSPPWLTWGIVALLMFAVVLLWRSTASATRVAMLISASGVLELAALYIQLQYPVIPDTSLIHIAVAAYLIAIALDELDLRKLLGLVAERRFQHIAMSLGEGLVCGDDHGRISFWNSGAEQIFGYSSHEIIGKSVSILYEPGKATPDTAPLANGWFGSENGAPIELEGRRKDGAVFPLEACFSAWQGIDGIHYGATLRDISVRKREAQRILYLAEHDTLTGLVNRSKIHQRIGELTAAGGIPAALLMLDLDKFKQINDTLGHASGDAVLRLVADHLKTVSEIDAVIGRLGGDEFAIVLVGENALDRAKSLSDTICRHFAHTSFRIGSRQLRVEVSVGIAACPDHSEDMLGNADLALYEAKARSRGGWVVFEHAFRSRLQDRLSLEAELLRAVKDGEFELYYQPQIALADNRLVGAEALIRWKHPQRGLVLPDQFMPVVNASSISDQICLWALRSACNQGRRWEEQGNPIRIGVNLAPSQFLTDELPEVVASVLKESGLSPHLLELEVTETILLDDNANIQEIFRRLQSLGVRVAFDDFGTGYASLTHLKKFPLDRLKIDKSFVLNMNSNRDDLAIVGAMLAMARLLDIEVTAEGVEDAETARTLSEKGCNEAQGYLYGRPMPATDFGARYLEARPAFGRATVAA